jgi:hypothetical protein
LSPTKSLVALLSTEQSQHGNDTPRPDAQNIVDFGAQS